PHDADSLSLHDALPIYFGLTWTRVGLPAGRGNGEYFVAVRPTTGLGVVASVVYLPPVKGRSGIGGIVRGYPPLTVRAFDGGRPQDRKSTRLNSSHLVIS